MKNPGTVNIIGGGIAGLTTAIALKSVGIQYKVFEQHTKITYDNVGLGISANIFPILEKWHLLKETQAIGSLIQNFHFVDHKLKYIRSFKMQNPALSVNRKLFHQLLEAHSGKENIFLNTPKSIHDFPENEIVISADGLNSPTRQTLYPNLKLRNSNQILWRGISEIKLDKQFKNAYHDFIGGNLRFAIIHTGKNYYSWYAIKEENPLEESTLDKTALRTLFEKHHPVVSSIIEKSADVYSSKLIDIDPTERRNLSWFNQKRLMIGDAIHPSTPNMANGACLAIEDAYLLANLLSRDKLSLHETFSTFQKQRASKVDKVVVQSWRLGQLLHQKNWMIDSLIKWGISITPGFMFDKIYADVLAEIKIDKTATKTNTQIKI